MPGTRIRARLLVLLAAFFLLLCVLVPVAGTQAQTQPVSTTPTPAPSEELPGEPVQETLEATVLRATEPQPCSDAGTTPDPTLDPGAPTQQCQTVEVLFTSGGLKGKTVVIEEGRLPVASRSSVTYGPGDTVLVDYLHGPGIPSQFFITDFVRTNQLLVLALVFVALAILFGGLRGFTSVLGLAISFGVLLFFMMPRIVAGDDPVLISVTGGMAIMAVTLYLSHGFNRKTTAALGGTIVGLLITGVLALVVVDLVKLTGFGSDEASFVQIAAGGTINVRGLLLAGIIIGALGVLDDVTIGQSAAVFELRKVDPGLTWQRLFTHAINIGKDHIAATVNTLVLAYAGASLPLLVLFVLGNEGWGRVVNQEVVAEEVVRTLVGSIGLMASVPITTWIASLIAVRTPPEVRAPGETAHAHHGHQH